MTFQSLCEHCRAITKYIRFCNPPPYGNRTLWSVSMRALVPQQQGPAKSLFIRIISTVIVYRLPDFQRHDTFHSQVDFLLQFLGGPIKDIQMSTIITLCDILDIQAFRETSRVTPLGTDHNIVIRLIPVVISVKKNQLYD